MGNTLLRSTDPIPDQQPSEQWRYMSLNIEQWADTQFILNQHGKSGWELVTLFPNSGQYYCVLKQKISN